MIFLVFVIFFLIFLVVTISILKSVVKGSDCIPTFNRCLGHILLPCDVITLLYFHNTHSLNQRQKARHHGRSAES